MRRWRIRDMGSHKATIEGDDAMKAIFLAIFFRMRGIPQRSGWMPVALGIFALACLSSAPAFGQTWNGSVSDLWLTGTNWIGNTAPNSSTAVVDILSATNNPVVLNGSASISTLTMGASTSLNVTAGLFSLYGASISNAGMISLDSQLQLNDNVTLSGAGSLTMVAGQFGTNGAAVHPDKPEHHSRDPDSSGRTPAPCTRIVSLSQ
jgi:hypothetical protein